MQSRATVTLVVALAIVIIAAALAWRYWSELPSAADAVVLPEFSEAAQAGEVAYGAHCAKCHGVNALGSDEGPPLLHSYYEPNHHSDEAFRLAIANGARQHHWSFGNMPAQPDVSTEDVELIIIYVRELQAANGIGS